MALRNGGKVNSGCVGRQCNRSQVFQAALPGVLPRTIAMRADTPTSRLCSGRGPLYEHLGIGIPL